MARSMIARRQEAERERIANYEATLRRVSAGVRPAPDFAAAMDEAGRGFADRIVRSGDGWQPKLKTRNAGRLQLAAARHLFALYPVPAPLERIWLDTEGLEAEEIELRKRWYIVAARGGSLWREAAREWLTRAEAHAFLNAPGDLSFEQACWHAIARSYTQDAGTALRIARSRIARSPRAEIGFWREAARFFCANLAPLEAIDDFCDFLADRHARDARWSLKGRTLTSLTRLSREWHRDVAAVARIEAARRRLVRNAGAAPEPSRWAGASIANWSWQPSGKERARETYSVIQLASAEDLVAESRAMHHCVWTYAGKCISGHASIWSLRRNGPGGADRLLTIELDRRLKAVQVRGFGNRLARADEKNVLERWAKARGVTL